MTVIDPRAGATTQRLRPTAGSVTDCSWLNAFANIADRSLFSVPANALVDAACGYEYSQLWRHCLLRPLPIAAGQRVLEIGCGVGSITRYLGELGAHVHAYETEPEWAAIAALRCEDLSTVDVTSGSPDPEVDAQRYDWILMVDSSLWCDDPSPDRLLTLLRGCLNAKGQLVLAWENSHGLSRLLEPRSAQCARSLSEAIACLTTSGLYPTGVYYPFPDLNCPRVIVSEQGLHADDFDAAGLLLTPTTDSSAENRLWAWDDRLVYAALRDNDALLAELANCFMVTAAASSFTPVSTGLAWRFKADNKEAYCLQTHFERKLDNSISVIRQSMTDAGRQAAVMQSGPLTLHTGVTSYLHGHNWLANVLRKIATASTPEEIADALNPWFEQLLHNIVPCAGPGQSEAATAVVENFAVAGAFFDAMPSRTVATATGLQLLPPTRTYSEEMPLAWLLASGVFDAVSRVRRDNIHVVDVEAVVRAMYDRQGLKEKNFRLEAWALWCAKLYRIETGRVVSPQQFLKPGSPGRNVFTEIERMSAANVALDRGIAQRDAQLEQIAVRLEDRRDRAAALNVALAERDSRVRGLEEELTARNQQILALEKQLEAQAQKIAGVESSRWWQLSQRLSWVAYQRLRVLALASALQKLLTQQGGIIAAAQSLARAWATSQTQGIKDLLRSTAVVESAAAETSNNDSCPDFGKEEPLQEDCNEAVGRYDYAAWLERYEREYIADYADSATLTSPVRIIFVLRLHGWTAVKALQESWRALQQQSFKNWEMLCLVTKPSAGHRPDGAASECDRIVGEVASIAKKDRRVKVMTESADSGFEPSLQAAIPKLDTAFCGVLHAGDVMPSDALLRLAGAIHARPGVKLVYFDEDRVDGQGQRTDPVFKSAWDPELLRSQNYLGRGWILQAATIHAAGGFTLIGTALQEYDLLLRCSEEIGSADTIHLPNVLLHQSVAAPESRPAGSAEPINDVYRPAVQAEPAAIAKKAAAAVTTHIACSVGRASPLVSVVIPRVGRLEALRSSLTSLLAMTHYPLFEILVACGPEDDPAAMACAEATAADDTRVQVVMRTHGMSWAARVNELADTARGSVLCIMRAGDEPMQEHWLHELVSLAVRDDVGATGATIWSEQNTLLEGALVLGLGGIAGTVHAGIARGERGYLDRLCYRQSASAVPAAGMTMRRDRFESVNGLDAMHLPEDLSALDLCLRLDERGLKNIWTPGAELRRRSVADGLNEDFVRHRQCLAAEVMHLQRRWGTRLKQDRFYSSNLTLISNDCDYAWPPRDRLSGISAAL